MLLHISKYFEGLLGSFWEQIWSMLVQEQITKGWEKEMKVWYKSDTPMKESTLLNKVMSIRRKEAQGEVDFYIDRILFIFVVTQLPVHTWAC